MLERFDQRVLWTVAVVACLAAGLGYALSTPAMPATLDIDHLVYRDTLSAMQEGSGYYEAMDQSLREHIGPSATVRAFRQPVFFWLLHWLPLFTLYPVLVVLAVATGLGLAWLARAPLLAPFVTLYLAVGGFPQLAHGWHAQYLAVEFWTVPVLVAAVVAWLRDRPWAAAALCLAAALLREPAGGLLVAGLFLAWRRGGGIRAMIPWLAAGAAGAVLYGAHAIAVLPYLTDGAGYEAPLLGTGGLRSVAEMAGFNLPLPWLLGPLLWAVALWRARSDQATWLLWPLLAMPVLGLLVDRRYWGILCVPFLLTLALTGPLRPAVVTAGRARPARAGR